MCHLCRGFCVRKKGQALSISRIPSADRTELAINLVCWRLHSLEDCRGQRLRPSVYFLRAGNLERQQL